MRALMLLVLVMLLLILGLILLLRRVRADHDAKIAEHWRKNGRERRSKGW